MELIPSLFTFISNNNDAFRYILSYCESSTKHILHITHKTFHKFTSSDRKSINSSIAIQYLSAEYYHISTLPSEISNNFLGIVRTNNLDFIRQTINTRQIDKLSNVIATYLCFIYDTLSIPIIEYLIYDTITMPTYIMSKDRIKLRYRILENKNISSFYTFELAKFLHSSKAQINGTVFVSAILSGDISYVKWTDNIVISKIEKKISFSSYTSDKISPKIFLFLYHNNYMTISDNNLIYDYSYSNNLTKEIPIPSNFISPSTILHDASNNIFDLSKIKTTDFLQYHKIRIFKYAIIHKQSDIHQDAYFSEYIIHDMPTTIAIINTFSLDFFQHYLSNKDKKQSRYPPHLIHEILKIDNNKPILDLICKNIDLYSTIQIHKENRSLSHYILNFRDFWNNYSSLRICPLDIKYICESTDRSLIKLLLKTQNIIEHIIKYSDLQTIKDYLSVHKHIEKTYSMTNLSLQFRNMEISKYIISIENLDPHSLVYAFMNSKDAAEWLLRSYPEFYSLPENFTIDTFMNLSKDTISLTMKQMCSWLLTKQIHITNNTVKKAILTDNAIVYRHITSHIDYTITLESILEMIIYESTDVMLYVKSINQLQFPFCCYRTDGKENIKKIKKLIKLSNYCMIKTVAMKIKYHNCSTPKCSICKKIKEIRSFDTIESLIKTFLDIYF